MPDHAGDGVEHDGWATHEAQQRRAWLQSSPAQRLSWLEQAIGFAHAAGALPAPDDRADAAATPPGAPAETATPDQPTSRTATPPRGYR